MTAGIQSSSAVGTNYSHTHFYIGSSLFGQKRTDFFCIVDKTLTTKKRGLFQERYTQNPSRLFDTRHARGILTSLGLAGGSLRGKNALAIQQINCELHSCLEALNKLRIAKAAQHFNKAKALSLEHNIPLNNRFVSNLEQRFINLELRYGPVEGSEHATQSPRPTPSSASPVANVPTEPLSLWEILVQQLQSFFAFPLTKLKEWLPI